MEFSNPTDAEIRAILSHPATVAVLGCSDNPARDSLRIAILLKHKGFRVIPVNPRLGSDALMDALGERCYPDLASIPGAVEIVDVFRRPEYLPEIAEAAIAKGTRAPWGTRGVVPARGGQSAGRRACAGSRIDGRDGPLSGDRVWTAVLRAAHGGGAS